MRLVICKTCLAFRIGVDEVVALRSEAMVVSVLVAVGWKWMPDTNHCNPDRGYWLPWHCSARFFDPWDGPREVAQWNHISNVVSGGVLTWSVDSFELTEPRLNAPYWI